MSFVLPSPDAAAQTRGIVAHAQTADEIEMCIFNVDGTPNTTSTPGGSFIQYRDRNSASVLPQPAFQDRGNGRWTFTPSESDKETGVGFYVDFGANAYPRYWWGAIFGADNPFGVWTPFNGATPGGAAQPPLLNSGRGLYQDLEGADRTPPTPVLMNGGHPIFYAVTPTAGDLAAGVLLRMGSPNLGVVHYDSVDLILKPTAGDSTAPTISDVTPAAGTPLEATDVLAFKATDSGGNLARANVLAYYPTLRRFEVVYFGSSFAAGDYAFTSGFGPQYTGTRGAIANGFQFSNVIRLGGWPAAPTFVIDAGDDAGNESA